MTKNIEELLVKQNASVEETPVTESLVSEAQSVSEYSNDTVVNLLKQSVDIHWQQAMELTGQGAHLTRWGYKKLGDLFTAYGKEEVEHATIAISRLEFFDIDYQPISVTPRVWKRHDVKAIIEFNLDGVKNAAQIERATITAARLSGDEMTSQIVIPLLKGSDDGIAEFERMLKLIEQMGIDNFLTLQV
jgi:bacterioferritin (cytochrome b1)